MFAPAVPTLVPNLACVPNLASLDSASPKLGLRAPPSARPSTRNLDEFAGLDRLDRDELDEDYVPPSLPSLSRVA